MSLLKLCIVSALSAWGKLPLQGLTASSSHGWHDPCFSRNSRDFIIVLAGFWRNIWLLLFFLFFQGVFISIC